LSALGFFPSREDYTATWTQLNQTLQRFSANNFGPSDAEQALPLLSGIEQRRQQWIDSLIRTIEQLRQRRGAELLPSVNLQQLRRQCAEITPEMVERARIALRGIAAQTPPTNVNRSDIQVISAAGRDCISHLKNE
jgi:hypothetical protein